MNRLANFYWSHRLGVWVAMFAIVAMKTACDVNGFDEGESLEMIPCG